MKDNGRLAVITPVYNVTAYFEQALASAAGQDYPFKEIIVVNDGSDTEQSAEITRICGRFPAVTLLQQEHGGAAKARRTGITHTSADWILFFDADDILLPGTLSYFADVLQAHPEAIAAYGRRVMIDREGKIISEPKPAPEGMVSGREVLPMQLSGRFLLSNGTVCMRKSIVETMPFYNLRQGEDWVLWCHLALAGHIIPAGERIVLQYRRHDKNASNNYIKDPSLLYTALDVVFTDPLFIHAVGEQRLKELYETYSCRIHAQLASGYAAQSDRQKAMDYLIKGAKYIRQLNNPSNES